MSMDCSNVESWSEEGGSPRAESEGPGFWTVAINLVDRSYGGPEEGGWWYDCGEPSQSPSLVRWTRVLTNEDEACVYCRRLNETVVPRRNRKERRRTRFSVISDGDYGAVVHDGYPAAWPETRPHYE